MYIENRPGLPLDVAALASAQLELTLPEEGPQVLIMHTHGSEAYTPDGEDVYTPSGECRTTDKTHSVSGWERRSPRCSPRWALGDP